jgi:hypothetical protein
MQLAVCDNHSTIPKVWSVSLRHSDFESALCDCVLVPGADGVGMDSHEDLGLDQG